jgi:hypothetical protein
VSASPPKKRLASRAQRRNGRRFFTIDKQRRQREARQRKLALLTADQPHDKASLHALADKAAALGKGATIPE